ncbi:MAG: hypothetical protein HXY48_08980 [Ignavibacteriaceae bacterium]|nr:hypothetical protein [Ignavibacteriaceae bacterium]
MPLIITLTILTVIKIAEPEEIDWTKSFSRKDKTPYGGYIIYDIASDLFPESKLSAKELPIYNILKNENFYYTNYVFINSDFSPDRLDVEYLLYYVSEGNNVFISAFDISGPLADSLRIKTSMVIFSQDSMNINFTLPDLITENGYTYSSSDFDNYFSEYDSTVVQVLGKNENDQVNFLRIKYGEGNFFLNTVPMAFTNYHLLSSRNNDYVYKALSHLPVQDTFWDDYYKIGNKFNASALQYILSQQSLKWAYYIVLASVVLFILFYGRRKQRIIPVIPPLTNTTVEFVQTVGNLYYQQKDFKNIAEKKISYFLDYIRNKYFIRTSSFDSDTIQKISEKSSIPEAKIKSLFREIDRISYSNKITEEELTNINYHIEKFYERTK